MVMLLASESGQWPIESLMAGLVNVFIISPGIKLTALNKVEYKHEFEKVVQMRSFYKKSSFFIFIFYTGVLNSFLVFYYLERNGSIKSDWFNMPFWGRKVFNHEIFKPVGGLYSISFIIILTGLLNILLTYIYFDSYKGQGLFSLKIYPTEKDEELPQADNDDEEDVMEDEESEEIKSVVWYHVLE